MPIRILVVALTVVLLACSTSSAKKFDPAAQDATPLTPRQAARITAVRFADLVDTDSVVGACATKHKTTSCRARTTGKHICHFRIWVEDSVGYFYTRIDQLVCAPD